MICRRCLLRVSKRHDARLFSQATRVAAQPITAQTSTSTTPRPNDSPAALTRPEHAQPFSTPLSHSPETVRGLPIAKEQSKQPARIASSVPAGTVLKGLNFMKNATDPIAMEDSAYPSWLWGVLDSKKKESTANSEGDGDLFSKSKKQRRIAAKALRKQHMLHPEMLQKKIPLYEQSVDLPRGDGSLEGAREALRGREELTRSMRVARRKGIKEANFLKAMR